MTQRIPPVLFQQDILRQFDSPDECTTPLTTSPIISCSVVNSRVPPTPLPPRLFSLSNTLTTNELNSNISSDQASASDEDEEDDDGDVLDLNIPFNEWLENKRKNASKKRYILSLEDYNSILNVLNNESILKKRKDLMWIKPVKRNRGLYVVKDQNATNTGFVDILVSKTNKLLYPNETPYTKVIHQNQIENIICVAHTSCGHGGIVKTFKLIRKSYSFVPRSAVCNDSMIS
jgi:hypothetical protein